MRKIAVMVMCLAFAVSAPRARGAGDDEVLYWNNVMLRSIQTAATPGALQARQAAIVHVAMFDAFNGIDRRYTQIRVTNIVPQDGASRRAAVIQAAFAALVKLFPAQFNALVADRLASLAVLDADPTETAEGIARGLDWGSRVASEIIMWRIFDGLDLSPSTYVGSMATGKWRPTPRPNPTPGGPELPGLPGLVPSMATTQPFAIPSPSSFRSLTGPPALTSAQYAADVNEVKLVGEATSAARTAEQTLSARFWAGTVTAFWNRAAATESRARGLSLRENARLFALLNVAGADAIISCWDAKYHFELWRPITAIRLADTDDNPLTTAQPTWTPLLTTPNYPEYDSGHQSGSGVGQYVMTAFFGSNTPVSGFSEGFPGVTLSFPNYAAAANDAFMARIWSGIHYRFAMRDTRLRAEAIAAYVLTHTAQPVN
jgi:hypothetical protein